jgi:hypothetical protein
VTHKFLYLPECPIPLLGRDLLTKLRAQITFTQEGPTSLIVGGPKEKMNGNSTAWKGDLMKPICLLEEFSDL